MRPLTPLELRLESLKDLDGHVNQLFKAFYDRRAIAERYSDQSIAIHIHLLTSELCFRYMVVYSNDYRAFDDSEMLMFLWVGQVSKRPKQLMSVVRLKPLKSCDVFPFQSTEMPLLPTEVLFRIYNDKLCVIYDRFGVKAGQLINQVVQSGPKVVNHISDESANSEGSGLVDDARGSPDGNSTLSPLDNGIPHVIIQGDTIGYDLCERRNEGLQGVQVLVCPVDPLISAIQLVHDVYLPHGRQTYAEDPTGQGNPSPNKRGLGDNSGEGSEAHSGEALNSPSPHEEVASQKTPGRRRGASTSKHTHSGSLEDA